MNPEIDRNIHFEDRDYTTSYHFKLSFLHPKHWLLWLLIFLLFAIGRLPFPWVLALGRMIGRLFLKLGGSRVNVTRRNLELCFPEKSEAERAVLLKKNFEAVGVALLEPGVAWFSTRRRIERISRFIGWTNINKTLESGQGVLVSALHMTSLEMACRIVSEKMPFNILYRVHDNPVYEYVSGVCRSRYRYKTRFIPRKQVKDLLYFLKKGETGIIVPDQDLGRRRSHFLPFFNIPAATIPSTSDFARLSNAKVVTGHFCLDKDNRYIVDISGILKDFPTRDNVADTARINLETENFVRQYPEQYLWQHRRFKTRPEGEPSLYDDKSKKKKKKKKGK